MKTIASTMTAAAILWGVSAGVTQAQAHNHVIQTPQEAQWGPAPPMLPPGAQIAVLSGNPTQPVPYAVRLKFPAHYAIPAHSHPTDEHVVVVSGAVTFGMGDSLTKGPANKTLAAAYAPASARKTLAAGGFALMPANMNHFAYTAAQETTIVLYGQGPVEFKYVNPADDPRSAKKPAE